MPSPGGSKRRKTSLPKLIEKYYADLAGFARQNVLFEMGTRHAFHRLWDARTGASLGEPLRHGGPVYAVAFSPQGDRVLTGSMDNTARLWDGRTGAPLREPLRHKGPVYAIAFSPKGDRVLTGSLDKTARLWDARKGEPLGLPLRHESSVDAVAFSPEGERIVAVSNDAAWLWDARTGMPLGEPLRHGGPVHVVAFSPQGDRILTGSSDKTARLWDARTGASLGEPMQHDNQVSAVAFSPQGDRVLTGSSDKTARLWELPGPQLPEAAAFASLATGFDVDREGVATAIPRGALPHRVEKFRTESKSSLAAFQSQVEERQWQFLRCQLTQAISKREILPLYHASRWLPPDELDSLDVQLAIPSVRVIVGWYGSHPAEELARIFSDTPPGDVENRAAFVLRELRAAIPELYWQTDPKLAGLVAALNKADD
jgi:WD40 repeat protein